MIQEKHNFIKDALLYERLTRDRVRCNLCAHHCMILDGKSGVCHVRKNIGGILYTLVYGRTISQNVDPVEKKPLFHFHPGSLAYSIATPAVISVANGARTGKSPRCRVNAN
jgi:pyruvate formate lyase activating enzyme